MHRTRSLPWAKPLQADSTSVSTVAHAYLLARPEQGTLCAHMTLSCRCLYSCARLTHRPVSHVQSDVARQIQGEYEDWSEAHARRTQLEEVDHYENQLERRGHHFVCKEWPITWRRSVCNDFRSDCVCHRRQILAPHHNARQLIAGSMRQIGYVSAFRAHAAKI